MTQKKEIIVGVDEVGRGSLAGPVVACALYISDQKLISRVKSHHRLSRIKDSKALTARQREMILKDVRQGAVFAVSEVSAQKIDDINIHRASLLAMQRAIQKLEKKLARSADKVLIDGMHTIPHSSWKQQAIIKGDEKIAEISFASIVAKVWRDKKMSHHFNKKYPRYQFDVHKGYGTALHIKHIKKYGPSPIHRSSFLLKILTPSDGREENSLLDF